LLAIRAHLCLFCVCFVLVLVLVLVFVLVMQVGFWKGTIAIVIPPEKGRNGREGLTMTGMTITTAISSNNRCMHTITMATTTTTTTTITTTTIIIIIIITTTTTTTDEC